jgi:protein-L-isoaspartate(D-aspartate) O-methyltransferase
MEFEEKRLLMVKKQLEGRDITDPGVLNAMRKVERHLFVPKSLRHKAYDDMALGIGEGQTISQPYMVAKMTGELELNDSCRVLEVGTGSGYQCAVLAELSEHVYSIERKPELSARAGETLSMAGYDNVTLSVSDGTLGWPDKAPFDRILITAAAPDVPETLLGQLAEGGVLLAPVGQMGSQQLLKIKKAGGEIIREYGIFCVFVPLIGEYGFQE